MWPVSDSKLTQDWTQQSTLVHTQDLTRALLKSSPTPEINSLAQATSAWPGMPRMGTSTSLCLQDLKWALGHNKPQQTVESGKCTCRAGATTPPARDGNVVCVNRDCLEVCQSYQHWKGKDRQKWANLKSELYLWENKPYAREYTL